jgi:chaperone modulatory protein CbpM
MKTFAEIITEFGLGHDELQLWVEKRWVLPLEQDGQFTFSDGDVARVQMIVDLRRDMAIDEEAMSVVLDLIDKLYGLRRQMRELLSAVDELPDTQRDTLLRRIGAIPSDET